MELDAGLRADSGLGVARDGRDEEGRKGQDSRDAARMETAHGEKHSRGWEVGNLSQLSDGFGEAKSTRRRAVVTDGSDDLQRRTGNQARQILKKATYRRK